ncbi:hypothetical protein ACVWXM_001150 [Bradyrhizobium sp. GM7.3]
MTTMKPAMRPLPRAMLIDMDDTILSAYARPEIAWNTITAEFAEELAPLPPQLVASTVLAFAKNFWANADASWRMKLAEARHLTVKGGFALARSRRSSRPARRPRHSPGRPLHRLSRGGDVRLPRRA